MPPIEGEVASVIGAWVWFIVFGVLLIGTVLIHVHHFGLRDFRRAPLVRFLDTMCLLPYWSFFAPNPGVYSYRVFVREIYKSEDVSQWREVPVAPPRIQAVQFVWNPHGRLRKALLDVCNELIESGNELKVHTDTQRRLLIKLTIPYIKCLDSASRATIFPGAQYLQFAIVQSYMNEQPKVLLLSDKHSV